MKKIGKLLLRIIRIIVRIIDKLIIMPIAKLMIKIGDLFKGNNLGIEKFLNNKSTLIVLSLLFSLAVFIVVDKNADTIINKSAEILYNQPVTAVYNKEAYVIEGLPETADITLIGRTSDIYLAKQYPTSEISVDLTGLTPGSHSVSLKYKNALSSISYKLDPSSATVMIYEKVSDTRELTYDILHKNNLDTKLIISSVTLDRNDVIIKGAEYKLEQVASVKALIDIDNITRQEVGTTTLKNVPLVAYDARGNIVDVEIVPQTITAELKIESPSKELQLRITPTGNIAFGKAISAMTSNATSIIVYGDRDVLDKMDYFPIEIDVDNLDKNKEYNVNISKPNGIRDMSIKTVLVKVELSDSVTKELENVSITPQNLGSGLKVQALSEEDSKVTVIVTGSEKVINSLESSSVVANVNLSGLGEGTYEVEVQVKGSDLKLTYESKVKTVKVKILKAN